MIARTRTGSPSWKVTLVNQQRGAQTIWEPGHEPSGSEQPISHGPSAPMNAGGPSDSAQQQLGT